MPSQLVNLGLQFGRALIGPRRLSQEPLLLLLEPLAYFRQAEETEKQYRRKELKLQDSEGA
eukprot:SAG22_NODE_1902_length_3339_cov_2.045370_5_plen_61_part_00